MYFLGTVSKMSVDSFNCIAYNDQLVTTLDRKLSFQSPTPGDKGGGGDLTEGDVPWDYTVVPHRLDRQQGDNAVTGTGCSHYVVLDSSLYHRRRLCWGVTAREILQQCFFPL